MSQMSFVAVENTRHSANARGNLKEYFFGEDARATAGPQAFRVNEGPNHETRAHFHDVDQYQVFFGAPDTTFQRHHTGSLLVHYADANSLYGPFASGEHPFKFLTLRPRGTAFLGVMPDDREKMPHGISKRHYQVELDEWMNEENSGFTEPISEPLFAANGDGLVAYKVALPPHGVYACPSPKGSGGQYHVIVQGDVATKDASFQTLSLGWADPDDEPVTLTAGDSGARLLILQFGVPGSSRRLIRRGSSAT